MKQFSITGRTKNMTVTQRHRTGAGEEGGSGDVDETRRGGRGTRERRRYHDGRTRGWTDRPTDEVRTRQRDLPSSTATVILCHAQTVAHVPARIGEGDVPPARLSRMVRRRPARHPVARPAPRCVLPERWRRDDLHGANVCLCQLSPLDSPCLTTDGALLFSHSPD